MTQHKTQLRTSCSRHHHCSFTSVLPRFFRLILHLRMFLQHARFTSWNETHLSQICAAWRHLPKLSNPVLVSDKPHLLSPKNTYVSLLQVRDRLLLHIFLVTTAAFSDRKKKKTLIIAYHSTCVHILILQVLLFLLVRYNCLSQAA